MASSWGLSFIGRSPLPILPIFASAGYVRILRPLVTAAQQQHYVFTCYGVIHPVTCTNVYAELPNTIPTKLVVAKVA